MIMAVAALLRKPKPTDQDINEAITNICRCGTFQQVREAIRRERAEEDTTRTSTSCPSSPAAAS